MQIPDWKRAVIKVGSALVAPDGKGCSTRYLLALASFIIESRKRNREVIVVSSGAVAAGLSTQPQFQLKSQRSIPEKQALAAIGQSLLMASWSRFFDFPCAQLLLTYDDILNRRRFINARNALKELLAMGALPIVNENDTVAVHELKVGDNDNLAAYIADLAEADLLIICSDVNGLYNADPRDNPEAQLIAEVDKIDKNVYELAGCGKGPLGTGGMRTKIQAADKATARGIDTIIINGTEAISFDTLLKGQLPGTIFRRTQNPMAAKKHWLLYALLQSGTILVDEGAARAICNKGASLLPSGVLAVEGKFTHGEAIKIVAQNGAQVKEIAKGITQYSAHDLQKIKGHQSTEIEKLLGYFSTEEVVHRDEMVLLNNQ
ncbi:glutamate 5-kinase [candidate division KSB1 bacterium]|nr:glutamate 5-kinase [candidate division KSB1 bacterium]